MIQLSALEIFEVAEQIERNGAEFYRRAAEIFDDSEVKNIFLELVEWEKAHQELFAEMREQLSQQSGEHQAGRAEGADLIDPQIMASLAVFGIEAEPSSELTGKESIEDVLHMAIQKEKDSIVYYTGLKEFVPEATDKEKVDDIIKEEMRHIKILDQALAQRRR